MHVQVGRGGHLSWQRRGWDFTVAGVIATMHADESSDLCKAAAALHPLPFRCNVDRLREEAAGAAAAAAAAAAAVAAVHDDTRMPMQGDAQAAGAEQAAAADDADDIASDLDEDVDGAETFWESPYGLLLDQLCNSRLSQRKSWQNAGLYALGMVAGPVIASVHAPAVMTDQLVSAIAPSI